MYKRILDLTKLLKKKSFFLFGPRGTGKTTLIQRTLPKATVIDLLEIKTYREYLKNPSLISEQKSNAIQKPPEPTRFHAM
jgi:predicted AAA+ superfamily ATPase